MASRRRKNSPSSARIPPDGELRRSQVITTYGPGALVDLLHDAVIISGLDHWRMAAGWGVITEPRLRDQLSWRLKRLYRDDTWSLSVDAAFRTPPAGEDDDPSPAVGVSALEFPQWFVCQDPDCRALIKSSALPPRKDDRWFHPCKRNAKTGKVAGSECVPVRFLTACANGHIDEFPWISFVHEGPACEAPSLRLTEGATGDFGSIVVHCNTCRRHRKLIDAKLQEHASVCRGRRPWLGDDVDREPCDLHPRILVRTASNAYFSQVQSALTIEDTTKALKEAVESEWKSLQAVTAATLPVLRSVIPSLTKALAPFSDAAVLDAVAAIQRRERGEKQPDPPPLRNAEFEVFTHQPLDVPGDNPGVNEKFFARRADITPPPGIEAVVLAKKLREVRALIGFTRIEPATLNLQGEVDLNIGVHLAPVSLRQDWLPAVEILGEGIFVQLDEEAVRAWEARPAVKARAEALLTGFKQHVNTRFGGEVADEKLPRFPGMRFYLVHSLAHLLMTALSLECGYTSSSIRERLYVAPADAPTPMAAFLLSTGTPGSEGTLGGLVDEGRRIGAHLERAFALASLCSYDPVCAMHDPVHDHADRQLDGAACHGCLYVAECSCERFNQYLDRGMIVPIIGQDPDLAYFTRPT